MIKQKNRHFFHIPNKEALFSAALMFALGTGLSLWAGKQPVNWLIADSQACAAPEKLPKEEKKETKIQEGTGTAEPVRPRKPPETEKEKREREIQQASVFHMASVFPEGQPHTDPSNSYGAQAFLKLTEKDFNWISELYDLSQTPPSELAARMEMPADDLPDEWCRISVSFYNGDGEPISGYSNASEILSLSSVYSYYHDREDGKAFLSYAEELWKQSHSYKISMSDVYYCDGPCEFSSVQEEEFANAESENNSLETDEAAEANTEAETETGKASKNVPISIASAAEAVGLSKEALEELLEFSGPAGYTAYLESVSAQEADLTSCKGHVDLHVTASILGIDEKNQSLFSIDPIGNSEQAMTENWEGWTELSRYCAKRLEQQDWFEVYGISCSSNLYIMNPLTQSEINYYIGMLPEGTSGQRVDVIRQALLSVGSIPYYWGGKPMAPGFVGNDFGRVTVPDQEGRTLLGLDCSGWISWVYWSALKERLPVENTSGLSSYGRSIQRAELQPGDLIIRTGDNAHVYLFLAWAPDGSMYVIHETGGITNNVTVSKTNADWPYYRSLLD